jgi:hypothetical protein
VEWKWQGKTEVLGEKPVPVPLCPPQIPHGPTRTRRKSCPSATLSTTNLTRTDPGSNSGLRGERPATNRLSHVTA